MDKPKVKKAFRLNEETVKQMTPPIPERTLETAICNLSEGKIFLIIQDNKSLFALLKML